MAMGSQRQIDLLMKIMLISFKPHCVQYKRTRNSRNAGKRPSIPGLFGNNSASPGVSPLEEGSDVGSIGVKAYTYRGAAIQTSACQSGKRASEVLRWETERRPRFEDIALPHIDALYRTARRLTGNTQSAEDLVQETYLRAYDAFAQFDGRYVRAWLFTIMRHTFISELRRTSRTQLVEMETDDAGEEDWGGVAASSVEDELLVDILPEELETALAALPGPWRLALVLADVEELSYEEIAQVMECPIGTVMSRLYRARRRLAALLMEARTSREGKHE